MAKIKRAIYRPERRSVTIGEYQSILSAYQYRRSITLSNLICVECGDEITYCHGDIKEPYFKHNPSRFGGKHINCPLFTQGTNISINENEIRKKLVEDTDVTLNFELKMLDNKWSSFITIPPFFTRELEKYAAKKSVLNISYGWNNNVEIPIDNEHFSKGDIKRIGINGFPNQIFINIKSNESSRGLYYRIDGFEADRQLFKTLINQEYDHQVNGTINLSRINSFACKRVSGKIYTGRHYLVFARDYYSYHQNYSFNKLKDEDAIVRQIVLPKDSFFNYKLYDVVFKCVNERTEEFCENRNCVLTEESDAVILWPPVNYVGNYKYFKSNSLNLFIVFENQNEALDIYTRELKNEAKNTSTIILKIKNNNIDPFYLALATKEVKQKSYPSENVINCLELNLNPERAYYSFINGVLNKKIESSTYKLKKRESVLAYSNRLEFERFYAPIIKTKTNDNYLLSLIRYSSKLSKLDKKEYDYLKDKYNGNELVINYLDSCLEYGRIKDEVKTYLMEEKL